jgi:hypothetical protein
MPPKKGTSTPNKPPDNPTWTLDEGEEMCRDINGSIWGRVVDLFIEGDHTRIQNQRTCIIDASSVTYPYKIQ